MVDDLRMSHEPDVYIEFEVPERLLRFTIGNSGQSVAKNIKFNVVKDLSWINISDKTPNGLSSFPIIKKGISYLPPNRIFKYYAGFFGKNIINNEEEILVIQISYENEVAKKFNKEFIIDMTQYREVLFETFKDPSLIIADKIERIERNRSNKEHLTQMATSIIGQKRCPSCFELIQSKAKKCKYCGEFIPDDSEKNDKKSIQ